MMTKVYPSADAMHERPLSCGGNDKSKTENYKKDVKLATRPNTHWLRNNTIKEIVSTEFCSTLSTVEHQQPTPHDINNILGLQQVRNWKHHKRTRFGSHRIFCILNERKYNGKNILEYNQQNRYHKKLKTTNEQWSPCTEGGK